MSTPSLVQVPDALVPDAFNDRTASMQCTVYEPSRKLTVRYAADGNLYVQVLDPVAQTVAWYRIAF